MSPEPPASELGSLGRAIRAHPLRFLLPALPILGLIVLPCLYYFTRFRDAALLGLEVLFGLLALLLIADLILLPRRLRVLRPEQRTAETLIASVSLVALPPLFLLGLAALTLAGIVPRAWLPWLLPLVFFVGSGLSDVAARYVQDNHGEGAARCVILAVGGAVLTALQIAAVDYYDTWLFLMVRGIPIPTLPVTIAMTAIAATWGGALLLSLAAYRALEPRIMRRAFEHDRQH